MEDAHADYLELRKKKRLVGTPLRGLVSAAPKNAYPVLIEWMLDEDGQKSRVAALLVKDHVDPLHELLKRDLKDSSPKVQQALLKAIALRWFGAESLAPSIIDRLSDANSQIRHQAALTLVSIDPKNAKPAMPALEEVFNEASDKRYQITKLLKSTPIEDSLPIYRLAIQDEQLPVQQAAAMRLSGTDLIDKKLCLAIFQKLLDPSKPVQNLDLIWCIGNMGSDAKPILPKLHTLLYHKTTVVGAYAALAICQIDPKQCKSLTPQIAEEIARRNGYSGRHLKLIRGLRTLGPLAKPAAPQLVSMLQRKRESLRTSIAVALIKIEPSDHNSFDALKRILKRELSSYVPRDEFDGMGDALLPLKATCVEFLSDETNRKFGYEKVAIVLAALGPSAKDAIPALKQCIQWASEHDRRYLERALASVEKSI